METGLLEPSMYTVKAVLILDNDGQRILAKYYDDVYPTVKEQKEFEKNLFNKTSRANAEIVMFEGLTCVYRSNIDLYFYVIGSSNENELILVSVLNAFYDTISQVLRKSVEKKMLMDNLDIIMLAMDELVDGGVILDADASSIIHKVAMKGDEVPLSEKSVVEVLTTAKDQLKWSLLK